MSPWPPPFKAIGGIGGVADFMPQAKKNQQELESRMTQMQEGDDDVDIPAIDTTTPMGQQADMTRDQAYMLNYQVNSFLSSCPLYLDNGNVRALFFLRNDGHDKNGIGSAWSGFDHDIICGAKGAARSVSDLPHGSNEGGANGVSRSVFDLPCSSNG